MTTKPAVEKLMQQPWQRRVNQVGAILRIELRKSLLSKRGVLVYLLALAPCLLILAHALFERGNFDTPAHVATDHVYMTGIVQFDIRLGVFFGCMGIFTWLLRGEIVEKTL
ncbi:MAG: hypothetical protein JO041_05065, partial [Acidobacteria bacterium]|nr:hypothetical protein [Acidobacteriota bacterium]